MNVWLGDLPRLELEAGRAYQAADGTAGEMRVVKLFEQLRLTWQPKEWAKPSTVQIRLIPGKEGKTTVSFQQVRLDRPQTRERMKLRWDDVLDKMADYFQG